MATCRHVSQLQNTPEPVPESALPQLSTQTLLPSCRTADEHEKKTERRQGGDKKETSRRESSSSCAGIEHVLASGTI